MGIERTFVMLKPDGMMIPGVAGELVTRLTSSGLSLIDQGLVQPTKELLRSHYGEFTGPVIEDHMDFVMADSRYFWEYVLKVLGPKYKYTEPWNGNQCMVWEGESAISLARALNGPTHPRDAKKTALESLRAKYGCNYLPDPKLNPGFNCFNVAHASGNPEEAEKEIKLWTPTF